MFKKIKWFLKGKPITKFEGFFWSQCVIELGNDWRLNE